MTQARKILLLAVLLLSPLHLSAGNPTTGPLPDFNLEVANTLIQEENALLLDIRTEAEFQADHIEGAVFIPFLDFNSYLERIAEITCNNKDKAIVLYCRTGRRAGIVKKVLLQEGYTRVTNMGGLQEWRKKFGKLPESTTQE